MACTLRIIYCHTTFPSSLCVRHVVPSLCHLATLYGTVSGCHRATLIIPHAHFSFISRLFYLCFFAIYSLVIHKHYSSSGLRTALVLIAFKILCRRSGVGTCIRRQLNAPILICLPHRLYKRILVLCTGSVSSTSMKKPLHLFAHMSDHRSINSRRPIIWWVCDIVLYDLLVWSRPHRGLIPTLTPLP